MAYERIPLSGSTNGRGIKIAATASAGDTVHTAQSGTTLMDIVTLFAYNSSTVGKVVTIQWGGTTAVDDDIKTLVPAQSGLVPLVVDGVICNSLLVKVYAETTNVVTVHGFVNRES